MCGGERTPLHSTGVDEYGVNIALFTLAFKDTKGQSPQDTCDCDESWKPSSDIFQTNEWHQEGPQSEGWANSA